MAYRAEYLWIDGSEPTREIRSKTKILADGDTPGIWGYDGSSTNQATGDNSDVVLQPVFQCPDPIRGGDNILVLCETLLTGDMSPVRRVSQRTRMLSPPRIGSGHWKTGWRTTSELSPVAWLVLEPS